MLRSLFQGSKNELLPLVSVVVNNYNYGRFLREAIDSALNQLSGTEVVVGGRRLHRRLAADHLQDLRVRSTPVSEGERRAGLGV